MNFYFRGFTKEKKICSRTPNIFSIFPNFSVHVKKNLTLRTSTNSSDDMVEAGSTKKREKIIEIFYHNKTPSLQYFELLSSEKISLHVKAFSPIFRQIARESSEERMENIHENCSTLIIQHGGGKL